MLENLGRFRQKISTGGGHRIRGICKTLKFSTFSSFFRKKKCSPKSGIFQDSWPKSTIRKVLLEVVTNRYSERIIDFILTERMRQKFVVGQVFQGLWYFLSYRSKVTELKILIRKWWFWSYERSLSSNFQNRWFIQNHQNVFKVTKTTKMTLFDENDEKVAKVKLVN